MRPESSLPSRVANIEHDANLRGERGRVAREPPAVVELEHRPPMKPPLRARDERHLVELIALDHRDHAPRRSEPPQILQRVFPASIFFSSPE